MPRTYVGQPIFGNSLSCDGVTQYAIFNSNITAVTNNYTMSVWANITAYPASGNACLFDIGKTDANGYRFLVTSAGLFRTNYSTVLGLSSGATLSLSTWYHLLVVRNAGTTQQYVNGVATGSTSATAPFSPNGWALLGASKASTNVVSEFANAKLDDARFYERALSTQEITDLYNQGSAPITIVSPANLVSWYKINELSGTTLTDSSGKGFNMTTVGTPTFTTGIVMLSNVPARTITNSRSTAGARSAATI